METLIESIRAAIANDASQDARMTGAQACRAILTALETKPGEAMTLDAPASSATNAPTPTGEASSPADQIASVLGALRGVPAEQLLDLAITRLRAALPAVGDVPKVEPLKFHIVQVPARRRS